MCIYSIHVCIAVSQAEMRHDNNTPAHHVGMLMVIFGSGGAFQGTNVLLGTVIICFSKLAHFCPRRQVSPLHTYHCVSLPTLCTRHNHATQTHTPNTNQEICQQRKTFSWSKEGKHAFSAHFREYASNQYVYELLSNNSICNYWGADPCTLTNCSHVGMTGEIHPKRERERLL